MHIEPGVVEGAKMILAYATGTAALLYTARMSQKIVTGDGGMKALALRGAITTALVLAFFQVLPHFPR